MKVREILTPDPQPVRPYETLRQAAQRMRELDVGILPVCEAGRLTGAITDRDIVVRAIANGLDPDRTTVMEVMTPDLAFCFEDQDVAHAAQLMESRQVRRLPVVNREQQLVGILSLGDVAVRTHREGLVGGTLEGISTRPAAR